MSYDVSKKSGLGKFARKHMSLSYNKLLPIYHYTLKGHVLRASAIRKYLAKHRNPKLQIGCGPNSLEDWLNADLISGDIYVNAKHRLPFKQDTFDFIYCEHFIEHLEKEAGMRFLMDCHRILNINGVIRLSSPDLEKIIDIYYDRNQHVKRQTLIDAYGKGSHLQPCELFNDYMHQWGHKFIYDKAMITAALTGVGFAKITFCHSKESNYPELRNLEKHLEKYSFLTDAEGFIVEAKKE